jgi:peroxiredoxin
MNDPARAARPAALLAALLLPLLLSAASPQASRPEAAPAAPRGGDLRTRQAPPFDLTTLGGAHVGLPTYTGRLLVLYFFGSGDDTASKLAREIEFFHSQGREQEIAYLGVSTMGKEALAAFAEKAGLHHDLASDPGGAVAASYLPSAEPAVFVIDFQGTVRYFRDRIDMALRELLGELHVALAALQSSEIPWRSIPRAPAFAGTDLDGKPLTSKDLLGSPYLIYFFEADCDPCRSTTRDVVEIYHRYADKGIRFLAVVSHDPGGKLREVVTHAGIVFPVLLDADKKIRTSFGSVQGNPDTFWVDAQGNARWREFGMPENFVDLLDLEACSILGKADPASLPPGRYVGVRECRICHEPEFRDWLGTPHAVALLGLEDNHAYEKDECLGCHVTGFKKPGGYQTVSDVRMAHVQCEACHGAGGRHVPAAEEPAVPYPARCLSCHAGEYALKEPLETALAWMGHKTTPDAAKLLANAPQHAADLERQRTNRLVAFTYRGGATYVGSDRCAPCHAAIHRAWAASPHGRALDALRAQKKAGDPACLRCHTTGYGELSGYKGEGTPGEAGVGCESCHGPGSDHVAAGAALAKASIYGLASDCPTCQAEATCRACHDAKNDPKFQMPSDPGAAIHATAR